MHFRSAWAAATPCIRPSPGGESPGAAVTDAGGGAGDLGVGMSNDISSSAVLGPTVGDSAAGADGAHLLRAAELMFHHVFHFHDYS
jgi:hypothetical protein